MAFEVVSTGDYARLYGENNTILLETGEPDYKEEWDFEPELEDTYDLESIIQKQLELIEIAPSEFTEFAIKVPNKEAHTLESFSFAERRYLKQIYDTPSVRTLLKSGRQVEKSTLLGNKLLSYSCIIPSLNTLYVSPTNLQTKTFSSDRLNEPIQTSDFLKSWTTTKLSDNVFLKQFINRSKITLRYAYLNADRCRGIPSDIICIDELQDIFMDNIPIIEETSFHSPPELKRFLYSGTPKSLDNTIEAYWTRYSTQNEWVVPCHRHSFKTPAGMVKGYYNILSEDNIGPEGLICDRCRKPISAQDDAAHWASMNPEVRKTMAEPYEGFRISQLMVPFADWGNMLQKQRNYERLKFFNEVLGLSYDSGQRPLTQQDVMDNCDPRVSLDIGFQEQLRNSFSEANPVYMGIDWGTGENTYTVVTLGTYINGKFTIFYIHRFEGRETEPTVQLEEILRLVNKWRVRLLGVDYGGGFDRNDHLIRRLGHRRVSKYQYSTPSEKVKYDQKLGRHLVHRTEVMSDIFNAIKRRDVFRFPNWNQFRAPHAEDFLNIFSEYSEARRMNEYKKSLGVTDDAFHSVLYCFLASMYFHPRPDVIQPKSQEGNN